MLMRAVLLGTLLFAVSGCSVWIQIGGGVPGSGIIVSESRSIDEFDKISFAGAGSVTVVVGSTASLELECDDNLLEFIRTEVVDGTLHIHTDQPIAPTERLKVRATALHFERLAIAGSCQAQLQGIDTARLELSITGSGKVHSDGVAETLVIEVAGSGDVECAELTAKNVQVRITGSGDAVVNALDDLTVNIAGSGRVRYLGSPQISQRVAGSGKVQPVDMNAEAGD